MSPPPSKKKGLTLFSALPIPHQTVISCRNLPHDPSIFAFRHNFDPPSLSRALFPPSSLELVRTGTVHPHGPLTPEVTVSTASLWPDAKKARYCCT